MQDFKIERTVWVEDLGEDHIKGARRILDNIFSQSYFRAREVKVECRELTVNYGLVREQKIDGRLGQMVYTGEAKIIGIYY